MKRTVRELQLQGALCLAAFLTQHRLWSESLVALVRHLTSLMTANDFAVWEGEGANLQVSGRDAFPDDLVARIPAAIYDDFQILVHHAVEIGMVDMYGADTNGPKRMLDVCVRILERHRISVPRLDGSLMIGKSHWGDAIGRVELREILSKYSDVLGESFPL